MRSTMRALAAAVAPLTLMGELALGMTLSMVTGVEAQSKQHCIPDNNPATGGANAWPFTTNGSAGPNWRYQFLIPSTLMPSTAVNITDISFAPVSTVVFSATQFQMRIAHTTFATLSTLACFDNVLGASPVTVYNGPITYAMTGNTWSPIGLQNSFPYGGRSNLVVEIRYKSTSSLSQAIHTASLQRTWTNGWNQNPDPYSSLCPEFHNSSAGPKVCFTFDDILITASGSPTPGGTIDLDLLAVPAAGKPYQVGSSLGTGPIPIGNRRLNLSLDDLLRISVGGLVPQIFVNFGGTLDGNGKAKAQIKIPNDNLLRGVRIHSAFVTVDPNAPFGIGLISNTASFSIN